MQVSDGSSLTMMDLSLSTTERIRIYLKKCDSLRNTCNTISRYTYKGRGPNSLHPKDTCERSVDLQRLSVVSALVQRVPRSPTHPLYVCFEHLLPVIRHLYGFEGMRPEPIECDVVHEPRRVRGATVRANDSRDRANVSNLLVLLLLLTLPLPKLHIVTTHLLSNVVHG